MQGKKAILKRETISIYINRKTGAMCFHYDEIKSKLEMVVSPARSSIFPGITLAQLGKAKLGISSKLSLCLEICSAFSLNRYAI